MRLTKLGFRKPSYMGDYLDTIHDEDSGMEYDVWSSDDGGIVIGASHEDSGLVTYYWTASSLEMFRESL